MQHIDSLTDLTLLDETSPTEKIEQLVAQARQRHVAAVCVYPKHLPIIPLTLKRATVLNFPSGDTSHPIVLKDLEYLLAHHLAEEIDYVFPYTLFLNGDSNQAFSRYRDIARRCAEHKCLLKVILETGAFPSSTLIETASLKLIEEGCTFLKTSTGKISVGATPEAASAMLRAIHTSKASCGLKISGGIRTDEQALFYIELAEKMLSRQVDATWFRIGRSITFEN